MGPEAGFDMGKRHMRELCGQRSSEGARRISLNDQQRSRTGDKRRHRSSDVGGVGQWILEALPAQLLQRKSGQSVLPQVEPRMLAGKDECRRPAHAAERMCQRGQLDCFGTGADDQSYVGRMQPSPYLGGRELASKTDRSQAVSENCRRKPGS